MIKQILIVGFAGALLSSTTANAELKGQFDLICVGEAETLKGAVRTKQPFEQVLHVDLVGAQHCLDSCERVLPIKAFDPLLITLVDVPRHGDPANMRMERRTIDRRSGVYEIVDFDASRLTMLTVKATCSPKPFTPFPATKF